VLGCPMKWAVETCTFDPWAEAAIAARGSKCVFNSTRASSWKDARATFRNLDRRPNALCQRSLLKNVCHGVAHAYHW